MYRTSLIKAMSNGFSLFERNVLKKYAGRAFAKQRPMLANNAMELRIKGHP